LTGGTAAQKRVAAVGGGQQRARQREEKRLTSGPILNLKFKQNLKSSPNLIWSKHYHPSLKQLEIKYQEMYLELRNKLCHWSFFKFEMEFEPKNRESKRC
jgi:hypothetical protein